MMKGNSKVLSNIKVLDILKAIQRTWKNSNSTYSKIIETYTDLLIKFYNVHSKFIQFVNGYTTLILDLFKTLSFFCFYS